MDANYFDEINLVKNVWQCLLCFEKIKPDIIHLFVNYTNIRLLPVLLFSPAPVVYDPYDCVKGMFNKKFKLSWIEEWAEKVFFKKADHLCARSLEPQYLKRHYGYKLPPSTYFPDYSWCAPPIHTDKVLKNCEELSIVYVGGINVENKYPEGYKIGQLLEIGRILGKQKIHLHIYPAFPLNDNNFKEYFSLYFTESEKNFYFHIHTPLEKSELLKVIGKYDAAINILPHESISDTKIAYSKAKIKFCTSNKIFDYIEGGLPIILCGGFHQRGIVRRYGKLVYSNTTDKIRSSIEKVYLIKSLGNSKNTNQIDLQSHAKRLQYMYLKTMQQ